MKADQYYLTAIIVGLIISVAGFAAFYTTPGDDGTTVNGVMAAPDLSTAVDGKPYTVSRDRMRTLCLGIDCVPSLTQPRFETANAADAWLDERDHVLTVTVNGSAYAFPISVMQHHYVVNTGLDGHPVVATYSPFSGFGGVFDRTVMGDTRLYRFTGKLLYGDIVMQDTDTGSWWSPARGEAVIGESVPAPLPAYNTDIVRWGLWREQHPDTSVLSRDTGVHNTSRYDSNPFFAYRFSLDVPVQDYADTTLPPKDVVYGVAHDGVAVAYRAVHIKDVELVEDTVNGKPIMIVQNERDGRINAFNREVAGKRLTFHVVQDRLVDEETETVWTLNGTPVHGELAEHRLDRVPMQRMYWFSWRLFHPNTALYRPR